MKIICAWCGKLIQEGLEPISHGICRGCVESEFHIHESKPGLAGLETLDAARAGLRRTAARNGRIEIRGVRDAQDGGGVVFIGHAERHPEVGVGAQAVGNLQARGIDRSRVEIRSFGSERPASEAPPGTMRARNRRVEIAIE